MKDTTYTYRVYAGGDIVFEDEFEEYDNSLPYYDDYAEYEVPESVIEIISMGAVGALPTELVDHILELEQ